MKPPTRHSPARDFGPQNLRPTGSSPGHRHSRLVDRFEDEARCCQTDEDLRRLLGESARELGFRYFALLHHASLRAGAPALIRLDNYPPEWCREMIDRGFAADDPVHHASIRTNIGFAWEEIGELLPPNRRHRAIFERSARFGLGDGFTVPANVPGEPSGSCSFVVRRGRKLPRHRLMCAESIGAHAFRAARRIHHYPASIRHPHLSRRELECLKLVAAGKTDWEVAAILGLSVETTRQYIKHARAAYDVVTRTQLVVHGLRDTLISFDDAIPPSG